VYSAEKSLNLSYRKKSLQKPIPLDARNRVYFIPATNHLRVRMMESLWSRGIMAGWERKSNDLKTNQAK
jgi:hypothetical protein